MSGVDGAGDSAFSPFKFDGGRYVKPGFPLETAGELATYQKLLIEVAKQVWLEGHPDRERVPKGFEEALELRLTRVERGSVIPYTVMGVNDVTDFVARVRETIRNVFAFVVDKEILPFDLRDGVRDAAKRFGMSLRDDEALYVRSPAGVEVKYTQAIRAQMIANEEAGEVERDGVLPGKVVEVEPDSQSFKIELHDGRRVSARFSNPEMWQTIVGFLSPSVLGDTVRFHARYVESTAGEVVRVEDVTDVEEFLDAGSPWTPRFLELLQLRTGWFDGGGEAVALPAIEYAREVLWRATEKDIELPSIFPTPAGGVQLELLSGTRHLELTISPDLLVEGYVVDSSNGEDDEAALDSPDAAADFLGRWSDV
jgi:hypothetical protein